MVFVVVELSLISGAHFIIGRVENALDGTSANGFTITVWNVDNGPSDNLTDVVGEGGNSGQNNLYMIDCELLETPCEVGDNLSLKVIDNGESEYFTPYEVNITISDAGFDVANNLTLNSPPAVNMLFLDDDIFLPVEEIDLVAASNRLLTCSFIVEELEGDSLQNIESRFFHSNYFFDTPSDNNYHYTNDTCTVDFSYGTENETQINCTYNVSYYADPGLWNCVLRLEDEYFASSNKTNTTSVNELLSVGLISSVDFGVVELLEVSNESVLNVTNYGNVDINLSLMGYGETPGDDLAMKCLGGEIPVNYAKYNLTKSNSGSLTYEQFENNYTNLTGGPVVRYFNLDYRENDLENDRVNSTYWRIYVPSNVGGTCSGAIIFGAVKAPGT